MMRRLIRKLRRNCRGATIVEFALILPALLTLVMGLLDLAYNMYTAQMLDGAIQAAARNSTLEGAAGSASSLDQTVTTAVHAVAPAARMNFSRKYYANFSQVSRPEDFDDINNNGTCDNGEPFEDANGNGAWDVDPGKAGFGGARDAVLYTVTVNFDRMFPIFAMIPGQSRTFTMTATTVLRNQPYNEQSVSPARTGNCA